MREITLAAGMTLALPVLASAQAAPATPDAGTQADPASVASTAKPTHREALHARKHRQAGKHHAGKAAAAAPAATGGSGAAPLPGRSDDGGERPPVEEI